MSARRLTPEEFHRIAQQPLNAVFRSFDLAVGPFQDGMVERFIVGDLDGFRVDEPLYDAISRAAQAVGDHHALYSVIRAYRGGIEYHTWELPLFDYEAYGAPYFDKLTKEDYDVGISLDGAMYPPRGEWGMLFPELFAVVGGSKRFAEALKREYPGWPSDLEAFLSRRREAKEKRNADVSWVQPFLRHLYGDEAPAFDPQ
jgi:hypothetical protein